jgi:hypothetical protein
VTTHRAIRSGPRLPALGTRRGPEPPQLPPAEPAAVKEAKDVLRLRYAHGEISREEYLQGKVELED